MKLLKYTGIFIVFIAAAYYGLVFMAPKELTFQVNEDFNAPIDSVFLFMTDPSYLSQWVEGIDSVNEEINTNSGVGNHLPLNANNSIPPMSIQYGMTQQMMM